MLLVARAFVYRSQAAEDVDQEAWLWMRSWLARFEGRSSRRTITFTIFFQAEDGIRDRTVTGVQTCALPISPEILDERDVLDGLDMSAGLPLHPEFLAGAAPEMGLAGGDGGFERGAVHPGHHQHQIGRASCRERV